VTARRRVLEAGVAATLLVSLLGACGSLEVLRPAEPGDTRPGGPRRVDTLAIGAPVPDFVASRLGGGAVRWRDRAGVPAVLVVWASWCPHCERLLPVLARVARDYPAIQVVSVATSIGRRGGPSPSEFVAQHGIAFPVALDDADNSLARTLGVVRYPTVYWVARDGTVQGVSEGEADEVTLRGAFDRLAASG
jgi:thiol-disulfide isomerase/thioredoxin